MGRKLSALEEEQSSLAEAGADRRGMRAQRQRRQQLIDQIAEQLGITATQLCDLPGPSSAAQSAIDVAPRSELLVNQQCADLVEAFIRIRNPQDRLRCLQIVRDAALAK